MLLETIFSLLVVFKPMHVMQTDELSCGAAERLMKERVKVEVGEPRDVRINGVMWEWVGMDDEQNWVARYQVRPDQYMSMELVFTLHDAYLSIQGIDAKRRPCKDKIYLKRQR